MTAAVAKGGSFALAYLPQARTIRVELRRLSGSMKASWVDPTDGSLKSVADSPFASNSTRDFTPPERNSAGDKDWVLALEAVTR